MSHHPNPYVVGKSASDTESNQRSLAFLQNYRVPYLLCPVCGQTSMALPGVPYYTCLAQHTFYKCPTCLDTRVSDIRENIMYCGLLHPYHLCVVHKKPVMGVAQFATKCTCNYNPQHLTRQREIPNWESPFI